MRVRISFFFFFSFADPISNHALSIFCLHTDLKGARHNGNPKSLRVEHKRPRERGRIKPRKDKRGGEGGTEEGGSILARRQASKHKSFST